MVSNGWWSEDLKKPLFWEQSSRIVKGRRVWADRRAEGGTVGMFFFQQSLGEEADVIISPAPIHKHGGGMVMSCYTKPTGMAPILEKLCGKFPLWRYWGPLASPKVGRKCVSWFEAMTDAHDVDEAYLYLPTLDYAAQKSGPDSPAAQAALKEFRRQLERVADICMRRGCELKVVGDYEITEVTAEPVRPNVVLRRNDLFRTRTVAKAAELLLATGDYELPDEACRASLGDCTVLLASEGSWCDYAWWTDKREAPDFASHVDIHNKPGYDPKELFFFNRGIVKGTHGRKCAVAQSE